MKNQKPNYALMTNCVETPVCVCVAYACKNQAAARLLFTALTERGHDAWLLPVLPGHPAADRARLTRDVKSSDCVLLCLDQEGLQALRIPAQGHDCTVLVRMDQLEGDEPLPPLLIDCPQVDLSDWQMMLDRGIQAFAQWYRERMDAVYRLVENVPLRRTEGEMLPVSVQERIYADCSNTFGKEHLLTLAAQNNLALSMNDERRHEEALALLEQICRSYARQEAANSPDGVAALYNRAVTCLCLAHKDAETLLEQACEALEKLYGDDHPETLQARTLLKEYRERPAR